MTYRQALISLANQLDLEGKFSQADEIDENFEEFLKLLEDGKLEFDFTFSSSPRGMYLPNRGFEQTLSGITGD
jgi:hypothetical protein